MEKKNVIQGYLQPVLESELGTKNHHLGLLMCHSAPHCVAADLIYRVGEKTS